jgi:hypothetical protein
MDSEKNPDVDFNVVERGKIDDSVVLGLLARTRAQGFDAYIRLQPPELRLALSDLLDHVPLPRDAGQSGVVDADRYT